MKVSFEWPNKTDGVCCGACPILHYDECSCDYHCSLARKSIEMFDLDNYDEHGKILKGCPLFIEEDDGK